MSVISFVIVHLPPTFFFFLVIADVGLWKLGYRGIYLESLL